MQAKRKRKEQLSSEYQSMRKWQTGKNLSLKNKHTCLPWKKAGYSRETTASCLQ